MQPFAQLQSTGMCSLEAACNVTVIPSLPYSHKPEFKCEYSEKLACRVISLSEGNKLSSLSS